MAKKDESPKASEAAKKAADDAGLDIQAVQPSGAQGQVTKDDVAVAEQKQQEAEDRMIYVRLNKEVTANAVTGSDGNVYDETNPDTLVVSEKHFNEVLKNDTDREGNKLFYKGGTL